MQRSVKYTAEYVLETLKQNPKYTAQDLGAFETFFSASAKHRELLEKYHRAEDPENKVEKTANLVGLTTSHLDRKQQ